MPVWMGAGLDRLARSESLCRLSCPGLLRQRDRDAEIRTDRRYHPIRYSVIGVIRLDAL